MRSLASRLPQPYKCESIQGLVFFRATKHATLPLLSQDSELLSIIVAYCSKAGFLVPNFLLITVRELLPLRRLLPVFWWIERRFGPPHIWVLLSAQYIVQEP